MVMTWAQVLPGRHVVVGSRGDALKARIYSRSFDSSLSLLAPRLVPRLVS
jgi:hypothetical protein